MIKKQGNGYAYYSGDGKKKLTKVYKSRNSPGLLKRIREIEFFKKQGRK